MKYASTYEFKKEQWPDSLNTPYKEIPHQRVDGNIISFTYINHATVLLQLEGINILTDPFFSERAAPFSWAGPKRSRPPGVKLEDLPPIDIILISHNHYDHLDLDTLVRLQSHNHDGTTPVIYTGLGIGKLLEDNDIKNYKELDWEMSAPFENLEIVYVESQHQSGRGIMDQMETLWGAFVIKTRMGNIYFAGDTGYGSHFKDTGQNHGPIVLSFLPIGAYEPRDFMKPSHIDPYEAVQAHTDLKAKQSVAIHFGTIQLTYERIFDPNVALGTALMKAKIPTGQFKIPGFGETQTMNIHNPNPKIW